jgi:hypothetical protein
VNPNEQVDCAMFDDDVDELALGHLDEPRRSRLLAHAATCAECHASLESLGTVVDRLLLAAPQVEPPEGFESRVLQRIPDDPAASSSKRTIGRWLVSVAAVAVAFLAGGVLVARLDHESAPDVASIVTADGATIGSVQLVRDPVPHIVVAIASPRPDPGIRTCELRRPDGSWEQVGWWDEADIASGAWAVGIDHDLLEATEMRITADGRTLATATFD